MADRGFDPQLTVRGAAANQALEQERMLSERAGRPVWVKPFTSEPEELAQDLRGTDLVLVTSLHEDFGLVATEAASYGVPLLVGSHTGAGQFLANPNRVPEHLAIPCVVPDRSSNVALWADRAQQVLADLPAARRHAADLRTHLVSEFTWQKAGTTMMQALDSATTDATKQRERPAARTASAGAFPVVARPGQATRPPTSEPRRPTQSSPPQRPRTL